MAILTDFSRVRQGIERRTEDGGMEVGEPEDEELWVAARITSILPTRRMRINSM